MMKKLNWSYNFYLTTKNRNTQKGCFDSHINIIKEEYNKGTKLLCIFEDDATMTKNCNEKMIKQINRFITHEKNWDVLFLGSWADIINNRIVRYKNNIYKGKFLLTHSYIINRQYMKKVKDRKFIYKNIDVMYMEDANAYGCFPTLFDQNNESNTDIGNNSITHQKFHEGILNLSTKYAIYVNIPLIYFIYTLFLVFVFKILL